MPQKDTVEKVLFAYNDVFADIVNALFFDGKDEVKEDELIDCATNAYYKAELSDDELHGMDRDVSKIWQRENIKIALFGIENQSKPDINMALRLMGYDGASYREQLNSKPVKRYPVVTLVLYFGNTPWDKNLSLYDVLDIPPELKPYVNDYRVNVVQVAFIEPEKIKRFKSDFRFVAEFFVNGRINKDYKPEPEVIRHVREILDLLSVVTGDKRYKENYYYTHKKEGGTTMCDILDGYINKGIAQGIDQGIAQGIAQGITQGELKEKIRNILSALANGLSPEMIMNIFKVSREELDKIIKENSPG